MAVNSTEMVHFRMAKMCLGICSLFLENSKQTAEKCRQISENQKKSTVFQMQIGFTNIESNMNHFKTTVLYFRY